MPQQQPTTDALVFRRNYRAHTPTFPQRPHGSERELCVENFGKRIPGMHGIQI